MVGLQILTTHHPFLIKMFTTKLILINEGQNNEGINTQDTRNSDVQIYG
nr:hypothetical protein [uncultured Mediterranean phage uvMED]